jgi:hypothetical protein
MNHLDELLSSAGRVPGLAPDGLRHRRAALDAAIAEASAQQNAAMRPPGTDADRKAASRWWSGLRGKTMIGVAGVAAAAAAVTVIVLPSSSPYPGTSLPTAPGAIPKVTFTIGPATTNVTAAYVLQQAATAAGSQLENGWPNARYWHTESQSTDASCPGQVTTNNTWVESSGNGVGENTTTGPTWSSPICANGVDNGKPYGIVNTAPTSAFIGQKSYTWSQLAALPTDPVQLWPIVRADEERPFTSDPGSYESGQSDLFQSIWNLLASAPVSPALRQALYEVSAEIPGVTVAGTYTDSLGRTGTALHIGLWTMVVDTTNGQVLAVISGAAPVPSGCVRASANSSDSQAKCVVSAGSTSVFISAGPASSAPSVPQQNGSGVGSASSASAAPASPPGSSR